MVLQILHFSDIHFKKSNNSLQNKEQQLFDAIKNQVSDNCIMLVTGDSAYSGEVEEFEIANSFCNNLKNKIKVYSGKEIKILVIPGNHDCQNLTEKNPVRDMILKTIQTEKQCDYAFIEQASKNLINYFKFEKNINSEFELTHSNNLVKVYSTTIDNQKVFFKCYNTAFQSILHEKPGKMIMPMQHLEVDESQFKGHLNIACFHHPIQWLNPDNAREFRDYIETHNDIYLTGHEHVETKMLISDMEANYVYKIEGDVLQDSYDENNSGFNLITLNLNEDSIQIKNFAWSLDKYNLKHGSDKKYRLQRGGLSAHNPMSIDKQYLEYLDDVGANFTHPILNKVRLSDIYVYPYVEFFDYSEAKETKGSILLNTKDVLDTINHSQPIRIIFSGAENIGKTSLLKTSYKSFLLKKKIPILIEGVDIRQTNVEDFHKILVDAFKRQYISEDAEDFNQLNKNKIVVLIDNFNKVNLNTRYKAVLLKNLIKSYPNIIITGNELMSLEDMITDQFLDEDLYSSFKLYELKEFGYELRHLIIDKWNTLGREESITEEERVRKLHHAETVINTVTGANFVPCYPFFILTILQSIEASNLTDFSASTFGYYYQFLINKIFSNMLKSQREITEYENYLCELSFYLYKNSIKEFDEYTLEEFHRVYNQDYTISHSLERIKKNLFSGDVLKNTSSGLNYKYQYLYYYFLSKQIANTIDTDETKQVINEILEDIHRTENSNILMFLTHHTNSQFLIDSLISKAFSVFSNFDPCKLEDDINNINELADKIPSLVYQERDIVGYRAEKNKLRDLKTEEDADFEEEISEYEDFFIAEINTAFKCMEIIGQILKNNYGKIKNPEIENLLEETILLGLRTMNMFFSIIEDHTDYVVNQVNAIIENLEKSKGEKLEDVKKIESISKETLFSLCYQICYNFIKKISDSIGIPYLNALLEKVYQKNDYNSTKLVKLAIKLEYYQKFPSNDIKKLSKTFSGSHLPAIIMKRLVVNYLHLFPTDHTEKSKILSHLGIPIKEQIKIERESKQRKKK